MLRVAAFTSGRSTPGSRFRLRQYIPLLRQHEVAVTDFPSGLGSFPPANKALRPLWGVGTLCERIPAIARGYGYNLTFLQRELLSTFKTLEPFTRRPRLLDVDDALWIHGVKFIEGIARCCQSIVCGNAYLANQFAQWNPNVHILPTGVNTERFFPADRVSDGLLRIGWSGQSSAYPYLHALESALWIVLQKRPEARLRILADRPIHFDRIPPERCEFIAWSPQTEVEAIQGMDIGLMPLEDNDWNRGKCSYKMLLYMACGVPAVVSPVGMNAEVLQTGNVGLGVVSESEWVDALDGLLTDAAKREAMGQAARASIVNNYSLTVLAPQLAQYCKQAALI